MSGLGFESGGLSIAHAMTRGLSRVNGAREQVHGHQVAYGLLVQLVLEGRDAAFMADLLDFYAQLGLPRRLADLDVPVPDEATLRAIAGPTLAAPHARNFTPAPDEDALVAAMRRLESLS
ncbi:Glycerol dehydrogenase [compost metagenome]